jgi:hypothetical protein
VEHPALEVVRARMREGSAPGRRRDGHKVGLVVEGGGMRGVVTGAALQAMHDLGMRCALAPCLFRVLLPLSPCQAHGGQHHHEETCADFRRVQSSSMHVQLTPCYTRLRAPASVRC